MRDVLMRLLKPSAADLTTIALALIRGGGHTAGSATIDIGSVAPGVLLSTIGDAFRAAGLLFSLILPGV